MTVKREIRSRIETLEPAHTGGDERYEPLFGAGWMGAPDSELTETLAGGVFAVEREVRDYGMLLETPPAAAELGCSLQWYEDGLTAPFEGVGIRWDSDDERLQCPRPRTLAHLARRYRLLAREVDVDEMEAEVDLLQEAMECTEEDR